MGFINELDGRGIDRRSPNPLSSPDDSSRRRLRRTVLSAPGDNWDLLTKQARADSDVVMIDLEHVVHPSRKHEARNLAVRALTELDYAASEVIVRINPPFGHDFLADVEQLLSAEPDGLVVPKVPNAAIAEAAVGAIVELKDRVEGSSPSLPGLWFMVERPHAILESAQIALLPEVVALVMGYGDLSYDLGIPMQEFDSYGAGERFLFARSMVALACAGAGIDAINAPVPAHRDADTTESVMRAAIGLGFKGTLAISPGQLPAIKRAFTPGDADLARARTIVDAFSKAWDNGRAVDYIDGVFVDDVVAMVAQNTVNFADLDS